MAIQKYPIGHQDFKKIREGGFVYVDKTRYVYNMAEKGGYYFLSRPRRFGKSLMVSTLDYLFQGKKELFEGLFVYDKWQFEEYPIVRISFSDIGYREIGLVEALIRKLKNIAEKYHIVLKSDTPSLIFQEIIDEVFSEG